MHGYSPHELIFVAQFGGMPLPRGDMALVAVAVGLFASQVLGQQPLNAPLSSGKCPWMSGLYEGFQLTEFL